MEVSQAPEPEYRARLAIAARVAAGCAAVEPVAAALVVGSTALRRCSERADLDLVLLGAGPISRARFESRDVDGVRVELERLTTDEALAATTGTGWVWELRAGARLGANVPVLDPGGWGERLASKAASMRPPSHRVEAVLRGVYLRLAGIRGADDKMDAVRGCLDNLVLLALLERPRRYQKPKWALADLLHAGEHALVDCVLAAYGVDSGDAAASQRAIDVAADLVGRVYAGAAIPSHDAILALGHTPEFAEASYVSRCLDDAGDLHQSGRFVEAQYTAKFAARLAALGLGHGAATAVLFPTEEPTAELLDAVLAATDARRQTLEASA